MVVLCLQLNQGVRPMHTHHTKDTSQPKSPEFATTMAGSAASYDVSVSVKGRRIAWASRMLRPFAKLIFKWLAWREARRTSRLTGTA